MGYGWITAFLLVALGFAGQAVAVWGRHRRSGFLERRNIHPRWGGIHVMAAGCMLALGLWHLEAEPWTTMPPSLRAGLIVGGLWAVISLVLAPVPLSRPDPAGSSPSPGVRPGAARLGFLFLGIGLSIWLAVMFIVQPDRGIS